MIRIPICILLGSLLPACAPTAHYVDRYFSYQYSAEVKPVGDVDGHISGPFVRQGVCLKNVGMKDEEAGVLREKGEFDAVLTSEGKTVKCAAKGKSKCVFTDESSHTYEFSGTCTLTQDGGFVTEGRWEYVGGTGRFENIKGSGTFAATDLTAPPESLHVTTVITKEFSLSKK
jgi:hypothetical protein